MTGSVLATFLLVSAVQVPPQDRETRIRQLVQMVTARPTAPPVPQFLQQLETFSADDFKRADLAFSVSPEEGARVLGEISNTYKSTPPGVRAEIRIAQVESDQNRKKEAVARLRKILDLTLPFLRKEQAEARGLLQEITGGAPLPRTPVPDDDAQKRARELVRDLYKDDFASRDLEVTSTLASKLLKQGVDTASDPVGRFVLLEEARDTAVKAGLVDVAMEAIDLLGKDFEIDIPGMKSDALTKVRRAALRRSDGAASLARAYLRLLEQTLDTDDFSVASRAQRSGESAARSARDAGLLAELQALGKEIDAVEREHRKVKDDLEALRSKPDDPTLCLSVGRYWAMAKGDWARGLPLLARGSDAKLKELAEKDLAASARPDPNLLLEVADAWWDMGDRERDALRKARLLGRAKELYDVAAPDLTGLNKIRVARRVESYKNPYRARVRSSGYDLLSWIDPARDAMPGPGPGSWTRDGKALVSPPPPGPPNRNIMIPCIAPEEYDLTATVERIQGNNHIVFGLVAKKKKFHVLVDYSGGGLTTCSTFNGQWGRALQAANPGETIVHEGRVLTNNKPSKIVISVRLNQLTVTIDGREMVKYRNPPYDNATAYPGFRVRDESLLSLAASPQFKIHSLQIRPIRGVPKKSR